MKWSQVRPKTGVVWAIIGKFRFQQKNGDEVL